MDRKHLSPISQNKSIDAAVSQVQNICAIHPDSQFDYVCADMNLDTFAFKCKYCVSEEGAEQLNTLIPIEQILKADQQTVFANFPLRNRILNQQIKEIKPNRPMGAVLKERFETYFKDLRAQINDSIDYTHSLMIQKLDSICDVNKNLMELYNSMSSKEELKRIISDTKKSNDVKSREFKELCRQILSQDTENSAKIQKVIDNHSKLKDAIDFDLPNRIKESVLRQLSAIDMFLIEDIELYSQSLLLNQEHKNRLFSNNNNNNNSVAIENLMKLVRNPLNGVAQEACVDFEEQLNKFKLIFESISNSIPVAVGSTLEDLYLLDEKEVSIIARLIDILARNKEYGEFQIDIIQKDRNQAANELTQQLNVDEIVELVSCKNNFCSGEFLCDFKYIMEQMRDLFSLFSVRKPMIKIAERKALNDLSIQQRLQFAELAACVNRLTVEHEDLYVNARSPNGNIQQNSFEIRRIISTGLAEILKEKQNTQQQIDELLVRFPIFELLPRQKFRKQQRMDFVKTRLQDSSVLGLTQSEREVVFTMPAGKTGQAVSQVLSNKVGYLIRLQFNRPYGKHGAGQFRIGLIPSENMHSNLVLLNNSEAGFCSSNNKGATKIVRGSRLSSESLRGSTSILEMRWCVSRKLFFVSDSNYSNVNQVDEMHFDPEEVYRFGICFNLLNENDWKISILEFCEINPDDVNEFN